eukprot:TRINITY_DN71498_c0_g1_i1.p1 TRINITY_DN71498_c0_g1~~TRINITY_DN71498_c0_g1_i1.p1  ORF type:complete len:384 (+),score=86.02 TRINITY_DN71498_c0_g1_i1:90-1154(+)
MPDDVRHKIVRHFIAHAPPAEMVDIVRDVRILCKRVPDLDSVIADACTSYNIENFATAPVPDASSDVFAPRILMCSESQVAPGVFFDASTRKCYTVDPVTLVAKTDDGSMGVSADPSKAPADEMSAAADDETKSAAPATDGADRDPVPTALRSARDALQVAVTAVLREHFAPRGGDASIRYETAAFCAVRADGTAAIHVSCTAGDPRSQWSGRWRGLFLVDGAFVGSPAAAADAEGLFLVGSTDVAMHYYEDGNIALRSSARHKIPLKLASGSGTMTAADASDEKATKAMVAAIAVALTAADHAAQCDVEATSREVQEKAFRRLRRKIPLTKELFSFSSLKHALAKELAAKGSK